jgi:hypothetical protein
MNRRSFLTGLAALSPLALALHRSIALAEPIATPKRVLFWFTPNGVIESAWRPTGGEYDFKLGESLAPLEPYRSKLLVFGANSYNPEDFRRHCGISIKCVPKLPSGGHNMSMLLTGRADITVDGAETGGGISVDQHIANTIGKDTRFRSLELSVRGKGKMSFTGPGKALPFESDPMAAFARVFADVPSEDPVAKAALARRLAERKSVLDVVHADFASMRKELSALQRSKLDAHSDAIRAIEKRLLEPANQVCVKPVLGTAPATNGWDEYDNVPRVAELQLDIMAAAFACDLTRVATLAFSSAASNGRHPWLGANEWHHELSHAPASDLVARAKRIKIERWYAEQLKSFMDRLAAIKEGDGTVLDHTLIVCVNEMAESFYHTHQNMPFMLAGGASGALRMGRFVKYEDKPHNDLLVSVCNAMGLPDTKFGDETACTGPLPNLT